MNKPSSQTEVYPDLLVPFLALAQDYLRLQSQVDQLLSRLNHEVVYLRDEIKQGRDLRGLSGESSGMKALRRAIHQVAPTESTVLIQGETGTGKELAARAIHQLSPRRENLLVAVNCAALPAPIMASELFGHEAGAFTGAVKRRIGRFELASRGTLFLDEIAEIPAEIQVMLLRVLQERTIERVGGGQPIPVDVRIIAATHQDLSQLVQQGRFRADLFFRLNVFPVRVPPLRERREDIPDLARHFLHQFNRRLSKRVKSIDPNSLMALQRYPWPGNVRELENLIERAMIGCDSDSLTIDPNWLRASVSLSEQPATAFHEKERQIIVEALATTHGRIYGPAGAAAALGLKPTTLYGKMRRLGIPRPPKGNSSDSR